MEEAYVRRDCLKVYYSNGNHGPKPTQKSIAEEQNQRQTSNSKSFLKVSLRRKLLFE